MNRNDLVASLQDTVAFSKSEALKKRTAQAAASSKVYLEHFQTYKHSGGHTAIITVEEGTTFAAAKKYLTAGKTAVLNFANPVTPGGGAQNGAIAQEECLCRSSNLYVCLKSSPFLDYYQYNRSLHNHFYSDRIIYTKGVTVFKTDDDIPELMPMQEWFQVDVITCAAPYIAKRKYTNRTALKSLFKSRIKNIFEVAIENDITTLILGAFGCGAFKNPPEVVAAAFHEVITENTYASEFDRIVFAIKSTGGGDLFTSCPNIMAFQNEFSEAKKRPTEVGMNTLATLMLRNMCIDEGTALLDCKEEQTFINVQNNYLFHKTMPAQKNIEEKWIGETVHNRYFVTKYYGEHGYWKTYFAEDQLHWNDSVVLMIYDKSNKIYNNFRNALLKETSLIMRFRHPSIPTVTDIFETNEYLFVVVRELIEGTSLSQVIQELGPMREQDVIRMGLKLADALQYLHTFNPPYILQNMIPNNVLLTKSGEVKLMDFYFTILYEPNSDISQEIFPTSGYAAPEQYGGGMRIDPRTDIYGLGITLHQCVTGIQPNLPPYETPPICQINPALSKGLEYIICKCIEPNPNNRYQSCAELIADLRNYQNLPPKRRILSGLFGKLVDKKHQK